MYGWILTDGNTSYAGQFFGLGGFVEFLGPIKSGNAEYFFRNINLKFSQSLHVIEISPYLFGISLFVEELWHMVVWRLENGTNLMSSIWLLGKKPRNTMST